MTPAPNMALQRTRGLAAAQFLWFAGCLSAVQALSGGRSPLNAVALGAPSMRGEEIVSLCRPRNWDA